MIRTKCGYAIAHKYNRIVSNSHGVYYEISTDNILITHLYIPKDKLWKITKRGIKKIDYIEFRTIEEDVLVYYQIDDSMSKFYTDYKLHCFYVDVKDVTVQ